MLYVGKGISFKRLHLPKSLRHEGFFVLLYGVKTPQEGGPEEVPVQLLPAVCLGSTKTRGPAPHHQSFCQ